MILDFVSKVGYAPASFVRFADVDGDGGTVSFLEDVVFTDLPVVRPRCVPVEVQESMSHGVRLYETKVTVPLSSRAVLPDGPLVFLLTALSGLRYLVGLDRRPYPSRFRHDSFPDSFSAAPRYGVEIAWRSLFPPLEVVGDVGG